MVKIEVLGTGCPKCKQTLANAEQAIKNLGIDAQIVKVDKVKDIANYGVMFTPALAINGEVKIAGKIPTAKEIETWLREAQ